DELVELDVVVAVPGRDHEQDPGRLPERREKPGRADVEDLAGELLALLGRASGAVGLERFLDALERAAPAHVHDPDAVALEVLDSLLVGGSVLAGLLEGRRLPDEGEVEGDPADDEPGERGARERDPG